MLYVLTSLLMFGAAVAAHIAWCRCRPKENLQIAALVFFEVAGLLCCLVILNTFSLLPVQSQSFDFWAMPLGLSSVALYVLLMPIYFALYFNTRVESPTQRILRLVEAKGGLAYDELSKYISDKEIIIPRLDDLVRSRYIALNDGVYRLTADGIRVAKVLNVYQALIGREAGG